MRPDGRAPTELRPVNIERDFLKYAEGSSLITIGNTKVLVAVSVEDKVPSFLKGTGMGWLTAEYSMLPRATRQRTIRDISKGMISGRSQEIQRLIGRSLRAVVDLSMIGERTIWVDADVIQADGGTRVAAITGGFVALYDALQKIKQELNLPILPLKSFAAAISVGIVKGQPLLDLCYEEDSIAEVDMNVVATEKGEFIEIQATAEHKFFSKTQFDYLLKLAYLGIKKLIEIQKKVLGVEK